MMTSMVTLYRHDGANDGDADGEQGEDDVDDDDHDEDDAWGEVGVK